MGNNIYITPKNPDITGKDVIILESDGTIDKYGHTFAWPVHLRMKELGYRTGILSLVKHFELLPFITPKPVIIAGGMTEATSELEWVKRSRDFFRNLMLPETVATSSLPVLGICFGAQILAESYMTGSVSFLRESEIGPRTINIDIPDHPLFRGKGDVLKVYEFHYNKICCEGLIPVSSSAYGNTSFLQAFQVPGTLCFGVQFHPEFDGNQLKNLTDHYGRLLSHLGWDRISFNEKDKVLKPHHDILDNFMKIKRSISPEDQRTSTLEPIH